MTSSVLPQLAPRKGPRISVMDEPPCKYEIKGGYMKSTVSFDESPYRHHDDLQNAQTSAMYSMFLLERGSDVIPPHTTINKSYEIFEVWHNAALPFYHTPSFVSFAKWIAKIR